MPLIEVTLLAGVFDESQQRQIVDRITDAVADIKGEKVRPSTIVLVEEVESGPHGLGGSTLSLRAVQAMVRGAKVA
jgi:4-oxalocrotonate tautomerase